jgi:hypothetical protein
MKLITTNPKYMDILELIAKDIHSNTLVTLTQSRQGVVDYWIEEVRNCVRTLGPESTKVLSRDINHILDRVMGVDF